MDFKTLLKKEFIIYDGGMGTMLQKRGLKMGDNPNVLNITHPQTIVDVHREYVNAGSDIICANTFSANRHKLEGTGYGVKEIVSSAIDGIACAQEIIQTFRAD